MIEFKFFDGFFAIVNHKAKTILHDCKKYSPLKKMMEENYPLTYDLDILEYKLKYYGD